MSTFEPLSCKRATAEQIRFASSVLRNTPCDLDHYDSASSWRVQCWLDAAAAKLDAEAEKKAIEDEFIVATMDVCRDNGGSTPAALRRVLRGYELKKIDA